jgi:hypothetical protein
MLEKLQPWVRLYEVIGVLCPIFAFSLLLSVVVYLFFAVLFPWIGNGANLSIQRTRLRSDTPNGSIQRADIDPQEKDNLVLQKPTAQPGGDAVEQFGYAGSFSYVLVASLFGVVLGMLVKLVGGFTALASTAPANTVVGAIGSIIVIALGVVGSLFADSGRIALRRPVGAIAFLVSFLVSGFYWQFLRGVIVD